MLLPPATKLGQGNIFRSVCQEFCPQGGCAWLLAGGMRGCWGACMVAGGHAWMQGGMCGCQGGVHGCREGHAWLLGGHVWLLGGCVWLPGGMCGCRGCAWLLGACMVGGHAWLAGGGGMHGWQGGMCGWWRCVWLPGEGACMVARGAWQRGGHVWDTTRYGDTINERGYASYWNAFLYFNKSSNM